MTDISNTEYITVNKDGIFVGGKPATTYHGEKIWNIDEVKKVFAWMQKQNPEIEEFHIGAFESLGGDAKPGNPDGAFGPNAWCRVKKKGSFSVLSVGASSWVFHNTYGSAALCASNCAASCAYYVRFNASFRSAVLGSAIDKGNTKNDNAQSVSKKPKTPKKPLVINLPWHIITIEKRKRTM